MRRLLAISLTVLCLNATAASAKLPSSVDEFIEALERTVTSSQPFFQFDKIVDPKRLYEETPSKIRDTLRNQFRNEDAKFDVLYRSKDSDAAETVIGAVWAGDKYVFLAFVLHKRPDGWLPISISMRGSYEKIMHYR